MTGESILSGFLKSGRFPHAILIEGAREAQVLDFARRVAMAVLCRAPQNERPCGECLSCRKVPGDIHPDLLTYAGEGKSRAIPVDKVREIRAAAYILPNESDKKILLLRDVQTMLAPAQNALLKILEEPPASAVFILTVNNRFRLLETVRSRVSAILLEDGQPPDEFPEDFEHREAVFNLIGHLSRGEEAGVLACLAKYEKDRPGFLEMLNGLRAYLLSNMPDGGYKGKGGPISGPRLWAFADAIDETLIAAQHNVGVQLLGCSLCAKLFEVSEEIL